MTIKVDRLIRTRRKSILLIIQPDGSLWVRAPLRASLIEIHTLVQAKQDWISKKQAQFQKQATTRHVYASGEKFPFLGQQIILLHSPDLPRSLVYSNGQLWVNPILVDIPKAVLLWYRQQARSYFSERVKTLAGQMGARVAKLRLSSARTRWGSCSTTGTISLTWRLVMAPPLIIDYVIVHELSHLKIHNHSRQFWQEVSLNMPDYKVRRKWLKENARALSLGD